MITKVTGFIVSTVAYHDTSLIINLFTKEYGLIGIMGKGVKSIKNRLRNSTQKFTYGNFYIYYKEGKLSTLKDVDIINPLKNIQTDIFLIGYLNYITDLFTQVYKESNDPRLFDLFLEIVLKIEAKIDAEILVNIFEIKCLPYLGVGIILDECVKCGNKKEIVTINSSVGGLICKNCYNNEPLISPKIIHLLRQYLYINVKSIQKINIKEEEKKEINYFLQDYYSRYTGIYLKSKDFITQLKQDLNKPNGNINIKN